MRFIFLLFMLLLSGCNSILQHKLEHYQGMSLTGDTIALGADRQFCSDNGCFSYLDLSTPSHNGEILDEFKWAFELNINQELKIDKHHFRFRALANNSPVILLLPGYGTHKADMQLNALYFRELGMLPIILPGPTETDHFDFGLNHAQLGIDLIRQQFADRPVFSYSFSMGAAAVSQLNAQLPNWQGGILVAPMRNFVESGNLVFNASRKGIWWQKLISEQRVHTVLSNMQHTAGRTDAELDFQQALPEQASLLILASQIDKVAPLSAQKDYATNARRVVKVADRYHPEMLYLWPEMRQAIVSWLKEVSQFPLTEEAAVQTQ